MLRNNGVGSLLAQRAVSEDPRWARAVEDQPRYLAEACADPVREEGEDRGVNCEL